MRRTLRFTIGTTLVTSLCVIGKSFAQPPPPEAATEPAPPVAVEAPAPAPSESLPPVATEAPPPPDHPLAGYRGGGFFLRDEKDLFILYPALDLQIDHYNYFGPGVGDTSLKSTFAFRRARLAFAGEVLKHWSFRLELEMGKRR